MTSNTIEISEKLQRRIAFLSEIEKLKVVYRQNSVINGTRAENSAEHSWHIAIMAMLLLDHSDAHNIDILKVMKMLLIHDIVEIDHGDVFLYDKKGNETKDQNERLTARRIFGLLPDDDAKEYMDLWEEFERRDTQESKYATSIDGLQPLLNHYLTKGIGIKKHNLKTSQIIEKKKYIKDSSEELWMYAVELIKKSEMLGLYEKE
jgi:putative hydrolase of HD superfamily